MVDFSYNTSSPNPDDRYVLVVPRRAYYDNRTVRGEPRNMLVILTEVEDSMVNSIVACEINGNLTKKIRTMKEDTGWVRKNKPGYTHCMVIVQCMGLPFQSILNGSNTSIIYRKQSDPFYSRVWTEKPLYISAPLAVKRGSVMTCSTLFGHPEKFEPWLKYQKTIGVDFVKLNVHPSFSQKATSLYPYLKEAIETGFVEMETWQDITDDRFYYHAQLVKYNDCLYRYKDEYEYAFFLDYDDFFNPVTPTHKDAIYHLEKFFANKQTGAVYFGWLQMECTPVEKKMKDLADGNLTAILSGYKVRWRSETKMAARLYAVEQVAIHLVKSFLPGYRAKRLRAGDSAYIAHVRKTKRVCS